MKLWSGRFTGKLNGLAEDFNDSLPVDRAMYAQDIAGSVAHATMLGKCGIIPADDAARICDALGDILDDINSGKLEIASAEDIHSFVETELVRRIGDAGKKLHTARSRNDQVATDVRLYLRDAIDSEIASLKKLVGILADRAENEKQTVLPAYTHMQKAQPTTLAHYLLAYANMFLRDIERLKDCRKRVNIMPLGSGACVATTFPVDRELTARLLGFDGVTQNSLDGVSDRDFAIEYLSSAAQIMLHLSRINEEFVYWAGGEFGFILLPDEFGTGSSIMPQKKNPDINELLRGKSGRVLGDLVSLATVMKSLPLAYNKDMQEDKEPLFDAVSTVDICLSVFTEFLKAVDFDRSEMAKKAEQGFSCATECADYLASRGIPFRTAHEITGKIVLDCLNKGKTLGTMTLDDFKEFSDAFDPGILDAVKAENAVARRTIIGGCAPNEIQRQINLIRKSLK